MRDFRHNIILMSILLFAVTFLFGTAGYMLIEHASFIDAFYMTAISVSTVGFGEVFPLSVAGKVFTVIVIVFGAGTAAYVASQFIHYIVMGELGRSYGRRKMMKMIEKLEDHYIICGYGRMGTVIADELANKDVPFIVIDKSEHADEELLENKYIFMHGDATREEVLSKAGIEKAKGLISVVDSDVENVYIILTARGLNKKLHILTKAAKPEAISKLKWAGADKVISPYETGASRIANMILKPNVSALMELLLASNELNIEVEEVHIPEQSPYVGKALKSSNLRGYGIIVIAVMKSHGEFMYNPGPETVIEGGDTLIGLGRPSDFENFEKTI